MRSVLQHLGNLTGIGFRQRINAAAEGAEPEDTPRGQRCQHGGVPHFHWRVLRLRKPAQSQTHGIWSEAEVCKGLGELPGSGPLGPRPLQLAPRKPAVVLPEWECLLKRSEV